MLIDDRDPAPDAAASPPDRRAGGKRHQSVLLVGRVLRGGHEEACLVHDISRSGLMARFADVPEIGEKLMIEVRGLAPVAGTVRWVDGRKAGLQFVDPQPVEHVFQLRRDDGLVARPPRFPVSGPATFRIDGERFRADAVDISAGGVKLATEQPVEPGQTGQVTLVETGTALFGRVCWAHDGQFGFRFCTPLPLDALARIVGH